MPKTVYMLIMFSQLLGITEGLHRYLQGERVDMGKAVEYKMSVVDTLSNLCTEAAAEEIFQKAMDICRSCNIQIAQGAQHKQKRLEGLRMSPAVVQHQISQAQQSLGARYSFLV